MKKAFLIIAGLLLVAAVVLAAPSAQLTVFRWDNIIKNAEMSHDKYYEAYQRQSTYGPETNPEGQFQAIRAQISEMKDLRNQLNGTDSRQNQVKIIMAFNEEIKELRAMFEELDSEFPGLRVKSAAE
ncbi:MAG: hypothetical protein HY392_02310 [Candidatus Diapherotrites archaeon]|nr:hypothetical protein [Candidatus Diapherotrites archaeon]